MKQIFLIYSILSCCILHAQQSTIDVEEWYHDRSDRITRFNSRVEVKSNGSLLVRENITIRNFISTDEAAASAVNDEIKRGIMRSFPTKYFDDYQLFNNTTFELLDVKMNGEQVNWQTMNEENGVTVRIGDANSQLPDGIFTYTITYRTRYQIKHLKDMDELAWNVTGNGWNFFIDSAECTIVLPKGAGIFSNACYTGLFESKERDCFFTQIETADSSVITFSTKKWLKRYEGLTVATSWKKGIVAAPGFTEKLFRLLKENQLVFLYPILALLLIIYNTLIWRKVGRDPLRGNVIPEFYPRADLSPAAMGYIYNQKYDNKLTSATMVDLTVRNKFEIDVAREGIIFKSNVYHINRSKKEWIPVAYHDYAEESSDLMGSTIAGGKYNPTLASFNRKIEEDCNARYQSTGKKQGFFALNNKRMAPGNLLITLMFFYLFIGAFIIMGGPFNPWQLAYMAGGLVLCIIIQRFFYRIIPAYTPEGRAVLDKIEGFRMYLKAADGKRINALNPPEKTLSVYERYMPFAIALGCEMEWAAQFKDIIDKASVSDAAGTSSFYSSSFGSRAHFASSFASSFSSSISSASTPPSSSSSGGSSSGGGSSGSGGGGGGGGGW